MVKRLGLVGVVVVGALVASLGAAPSRAAAPRIVTTVEPLLGVAAAGTIPEVTAGQRIGYRITVRNGGGNAVNNVVFKDTASLGTTAAAYVSDDSPQCSGSGATMTCSLGHLTAGATFTVRVAFTVPTGTGTLTNTVEGSLDPQTPNTTNKRTTDTFGAAANAAVVAPLESSTSTYGLPSDLVKTGALTPTHLQSTQTALPGTLNGFGTPVRVEERSIDLCPHGTCVPYASMITIPDSEPVGGAINPSNPFVGPSGVLSPFTWQIKIASALVPHGLTPQYVYHDGVRLPFCAAVSLTQRICATSVSYDAATQIWTATGSGIENGAYQFG